MTKYILGVIIIIRHPTSLYARQLPQGTAPGAVAWTISTQEPLIANARFLKLPVAEELMRRPPNIFDETARRAHEGALIFTLLRADQTMTGSNKRQFEIGEIIEFTDDTTEALIPDPSPNTVDIQHNNNILDLESIGLTADEIDSLVQQSTLKKRTLEDQLASVKSNIANTKILIIENQKQINETTKVIDATRQLFGIVDGDLMFNNPIYQKLLGILNGFNIQSATLNAQYNALIIEVQTIFNALLQLSELVH